VRFTRPSRAGFRRTAAKGAFIGSVSLVETILLLPPGKAVCVSNPAVRSAMKSNHGDSRIGRVGCDLNTGVRANHWWYDASVCYAGVAEQVDASDFFGVPEGKRSA
jgi:hypothetical protein